MPSCTEVVFFFLSYSVFFLLHGVVLFMLVFFVLCYRLLVLDL